VIVPQEVHSYLHVFMSAVPQVQSGIITVYILVSNSAFVSQELPNKAVKSVYIHT
jgi:hypothetical protein